MGGAHRRGIHILTPPQHHRKRPPPWRSLRFSGPDTASCARPPKNGPYTPAGPRPLPYPYRTPQRPPAASLWSGAGITGPYRRPAPSRWPVPPGSPGPSRPDRRPLDPRPRPPLRRARGGRSLAVAQPPSPATMEKAFGQILVCLHPSAAVQKAFGKIPDNPHPHRLDQVHVGPCHSSSATVAPATLPRSRATVATVWVGPIGRTNCGNVTVAGCHSWCHSSKPTVALWQNRPTIRNMPLTRTRPLQQVVPPRHMCVAYACCRAS